MNENKEAILKHSELPKLESTGELAKEKVTGNLAAKVEIIPN